MTCDPVAAVVSALESRGCRPRRRPNGEWSARCPAHCGKGNKSLSVATGSDGRALIYCFSGCSTEAVAGALGITMQDLFADEADGSRHRSGSRSTDAATLPPVSTSPRKPPCRKTFPTWQAALPPRLGQTWTAWEYRNADGVVASVVVRWDRADGGKEIRPFTSAGGGWLAQAPPEPRPLFNLPEVARAGRVIVVEGEKCAAALAALGIIATTSSQGARSASTADWSPLAGKHVVILPDHDEAGEGYARDVARLASVAGAASVAMTRLADHWPACPTGGDVVDWIESHGDAAEPQHIRDALEALLAKAERMTAETTEEPGDDDPAVWMPFPVEALPEPLAAFATEASRAIGVDPSMVALPLLAMIAGAIGNTRRLIVKSGWSIPPILWTAVIAESGSGKTPAFRAVTQFTDHAQSKAFLVHEAALAQYEIDMANYDLQLKDRAKRGGAAPEKPRRPSARRFIVNDTTVEALVPILRDNPRGVVVGVDELAAWFTSHDAYRAGSRGGVDRPKWLSMFDAGPVTVDRKISGTIHVPSAAVSITGGVQPSILQGLLTHDNVTSGLVGRFMFAMPPRSQMRWSEDTVTFTTFQELENLFRVLLDCLPAADIVTDGPKELDLDPEARDEFRRFAEDIYAQQAGASGAAATMLSKLTSLAGRLALVIHVARQAGREPAISDRVDVDSIRRGITIARWAGAEQERVYRLLVAGGGVDEPADDAMRLGRWLATRPEGFASDRDIRHGLKRFRDNAHRAEAAAARLVAEGRAIRDRIDTGGRPAKGLRLVRGADTGGTAA